MPDLAILTESFGFVLTFKRFFNDFQAIFVQFSIFFSFSPYSSLILAFLFCYVYICMSRSCDIRSHMQVHASTLRVIPHARMFPHNIACEYFALDSCSLLLSSSFSSSLLFLQFRSHFLVEKCLLKSTTFPTVFILFFFCIERKSFLFAE